MYKAESSSASNRCTQRIAFIAHKRSVSKNLPPLSGFRLTPLVLSHKPGYPRNDLVLIQLHPGLFCSHDLWHCACSSNSEGERFND
jgi:hypothetical protein